MRSFEIDDAFYQGRAILLVEDELTRRIVAKCWEATPRAKEIQVRAAGGSDGVARLVEGVRQSGRVDVFGLIDRDFGFEGPGAGPTFRTARHEIENHLLDFEVLAKIAAKATREEIHAEALAYATRMKTWMALRCALFELRRDRPEFPADPKIDRVQTLEEVTRWFEAQKYSEKMQVWVGAKWTTAHLVKMSAKHALTYEDELTSGRWVETFSGKELFAHVATRFKWRYEIEGAKDLAFAVADRWQRAGSAPPFLDAIRDAIVARLRA
jgi:hypothetical protein